MRVASFLAGALLASGCSVAGLDVEMPAGFPGAAPSPTVRALEGSISEAARPVLPGPGRVTVRGLDGTGTRAFSVARYGNGMRVKEADGCTWTRDRDWFSPSDSWAACGSSDDWHTASARVRVLDPLFPLRKGATGAYERRAVSHSGKVSTRTTRCEVTDAVALVRPGGARTPAFVVVCTDGRVERTTWYAPGEGPLAYREVHERDGVRDAWVVAD